MLDSQGASPLSYYSCSSQIRADFEFFLLEDDNTPTKV
jgi:hypothetical protein